MSPIEKLKSEARAWAQKVVTLYNTPVPVDLQPKKDSLLNAAKKIKTTIESVTGALPELKAIDDSMELGIAPIVVVAGVGVAAAAIAWWVRDFNNLMHEAKTREAKEKLVNKLIDSGVPAAQAVVDANRLFVPLAKPTESGVVNSIMKGLIPLALLGGVFMLIKGKV